MIKNALTRLPMVACAVCVSATIFASNAQSAVLPVQNASFEGTGTAWDLGVDGGFTFFSPGNLTPTQVSPANVHGDTPFGADSPILGWTSTNTAGTYDPLASGFTSIPDGDQIAYLNSFATMAQVTANTWQSGFDYTLSFFAGNRAPAPATGLDLNPAPFEVELFAVGGGPNQTIASAVFFSGGIPAEGEFVPLSLTVDANTVAASLAAGDLIGLSFSLLDSGAVQLGIDNVVLEANSVAPVPLPAGFLLLITGLFGFSLLRRKRVAIGA